MAKYIPLDSVLAEIDRRLADNKKEIERATHKHLEEYFEGYEDALVLFKEKFLDTLEVKEVDFWHKQSEEDIDDSIIGWSMHSFICLMKDGTTQEFTGIQDESYEGGISKHLDCVDDNYEWEYDDIVYWIEIPMIKAQKGE